MKEEKQLLPPSINLTCVSPITSGSGCRGTVAGTCSKISHREAEMKVMHLKLLQSYESAASNNEMLVHVYLPSPPR